MRKLFAVVAASALMLVGVSATAEPVTTTATLSINLGSAGSFTLTGTGDVSLVGTGNISTSNGITGSQLIVPSAFITVPTELAISVPDNASTLIDNVILRTDLQNGMGTFSVGGGDFGACPGGGAACVSGGGVGGVMPILGNVGLSLFGLTPNINLGALNIGQGPGGTTVLNVLPGLTLTAEANAAPWTTGQAQVVTANGTPTLAGSDNPLTLVSPTFVDADLLQLAAFAQVSFSGLKVVPEPGTMLLLGAGVAGLAFVGRSRRS